MHPWVLTSFVPDLTKFTIITEDEMTEKESQEYRSSMSYIQYMFDNVMDREFSMSYYGNYLVSDMESMSLPDIEYHRRRFIEARAKEREELENMTNK
jgi:hypothetical protein